MSNCRASITEIFQSRAVPAPGADGWGCGGTGTTVMPSMLPSFCRGI